MNKKTLFIFTILILLFFVPILVAGFLTTHKTWLPQRTTNHGQLLTPPRSLQQLTLDPAITHHHWILLLVHPGVCDSFCQKGLYNMHQIQRALGKDMNRLQHVLLTLPADNVDAQWLTASETQHWQVEQTVLNQVLGPSAAWYVVDPLGNIVLSYSADVNPEWMLDDIKHLMGVSSIG